MVMFVDNNDDDLLCMDCNYLKMQWGVNHEYGVYVIQWCKLYNVDEFLVMHCRVITWSPCIVWVCNHEDGKITKMGEWIGISSCIQINHEDGWIIR